LNLYHIRWTPDRIEHIAKHNLIKNEVEEAAFDDDYSLIQKLKKADRDPNQKVYRLLGCSRVGRYITFIFILRR